MRTVECAVRRTYGDAENSQLRLDGLEKIQLEL